jgi:hypothetical protein
MNQRTTTPGQGRTNVRVAQPFAVLTRITSVNNQVGFTRFGECGYGAGDEHGSRPKTPDVLAKRRLSGMLAVMRAGHAIPVRKTASSGAAQAFVVFTMSLLTLGGGCAGKRSTTDALIVPVERYDAVFSTAQGVLTDLGFQLDQVDYRFGRITTQPLDAPSVFEPWRPTQGNLSVSGPSTWNQQRRVVTITLESNSAPAAQAAPSLPSSPTESMEPTTSSSEPTSPSSPTEPPLSAMELTPGAYRLNVVVMQERRERPTTRLTGSVASRSVFSNLRAVPAELSQRGITNDYYLPVGRDADLEARIHRQIIRRMEGQS